jgi:hypothetical protein
VARDAAGALVIVDAGNQRVQRIGGGHSESWPRAAGRSASAAERLDVDAAGVVWVGGGGMAEVWRLAPWRGPERLPLADGVAGEGLALGAGRLWLAVNGPPRVLELSMPRGGGSG